MVASFGKPEIVEIPALSLGSDQGPGSGGQAGTIVPIRSLITVRRPSDLQRLRKPDDDLTGGSKAMKSWRRAFGLWLALLAALPAACRSHDGEGGLVDLVGPPVTLAVGAGPGGLATSSNGETLVAWNLGDHTLSFIDLRSRTETARIAVPVRVRDADGEPTEGYVSAVAVHEGRAWAATTEGQLFRIDPVTSQVVALIDGAPTAFSGMVRDPIRDRVVLSTEAGEVLAFNGHEMSRIAKLPLGIVRMKLSGETIHVAARSEAVFGEGANDSLVASVDLEHDRIQGQVLLESGTAEDLTVTSDGRILVADWGSDRILEFGEGWNRLASRSTPGFSPYRIEAFGSRVLVASSGSGVSRIVEYDLAGGALSEEPRAEYPLPAGEVTDLVILAEGWFAVALGDRDCVLLLHRSQARPFRGFHLGWEPVDAQTSAQAGGRDKALHGR